MFTFRKLKLDFVAHNPNQKPIEMKFFNRNLESFLYQIKFVCKVQ